MKPQHYFFTLLASGTTFCYAQQPMAEVHTDFQTREQVEATTYLTNELMRFDTEADVDVVQVGEGNTADLQLFSTGLQNSTATVVQAGPGNPTAPVSNNSVALELRGSGNDFSIVQQGNQNVYNGNVTATGADVSVLQRGNDNKIQQTVRLADDAGLILQQEGDGNRLDAGEYEGMPGKQITVRQSGGAQATLRNLGSQ